jgi:hypothetical protein
MKRECPQWAANIGKEVRLLTHETQCEPPSIASLLRQIDESELAMRSGEGANKVDRKKGFK